MAPPGELWVNAGVVLLAGKTVWSIPERLRSEVLTTMRYTNRRLPYLTLPYHERMARLSWPGWLIKYWDGLQTFPKFHSSTNHVQQLHRLRHITLPLSQIAKRIEGTSLKQFTVYNIYLSLLKVCTAWVSVYVCMKPEGWCVAVQTFTLPNLSARDKFKLTAHEGAKIRRIGFINFRSRSGTFTFELKL